MANSKKRCVADNDGHHLSCSDGGGFGHDHEHPDIVGESAYVGDRYMDVD